MTISQVHLGGVTGTNAAGTATSDSWTSTTGSTVVVVAHFYGTGGSIVATDCTDSKSNSYSLGPVITTDGGTGIALFYNLTGTRGASHTVTVNPASGSTETINLAVIELTGDTITFDSASDATASDGTSPFTVTAAAAVQSGAIGIYGCTIDTGGTNAWGQPSGYSDIRNEANGATHLVSIGSYKLSESGTPAPAATNSDSVTSGKELFASFYEGAPVTDPYVVASTGAAVANASPSVTFSGYTPLENDVIAFYVSSTTVLDVQPNSSMPSGWVNPLGDGVEIVSDAHGMCAAYHLVTAAEETAGTLTYTATSLTQASETGYVEAVAIRNVDPAEPVDGANTAQNSGNTTTPHVLAGITGSGVLVDNSLVVSSVAKDGTGAYSSTPGGWTQVRADNTNQGRWIGSRNALTTADTDVAATNITPSAGDEYCSITIAWKKAGAQPVNVNAQVATLILAGVAGTPTPAALTVTAQVAVVILTGVPGTASEAEPVVVTAQVATLTLNGVSGAPTLAGLAVVAQVAVLTVAGVSGGTTLDPLALAAQVATLTLTGVSGGVMLTALNVSAQIAVITYAGVAGTPTLAALTVTAQVATLQVAGVAESVTLVPLTLDAQVATLTLVGVPGSTGAAVQVNAQVATLVLGGVPGQVQLTAVQVPAGTAALLLSGTSGAPVLAPLVVPATPADTTFSGVSGVPTLLPIVVNAGVASLTFEGVAGSIVGQFVLVNAQVATLNLSGVNGAPELGVTVVNAHVASLTLIGVGGSPAVGGIAVIAQVATLTLVCVPGVRVLTPLQVNANPATLTLERVAGTVTLDALAVLAHVAALVLTARSGFPPPSYGRTTIAIGLLDETSLGVERSGGTSLDIGVVGSTSLEAT